MTSGLTEWCCPSTRFPSPVPFSRRREKGKTGKRGEMGKKRDRAWRRAAEGSASGAPCVQLVRARRLVSRPGASGFSGRGLGVAAVKRRRQRPASAPAAASGVCG
jgi:hypothetical protein